MVYRVDAKGCLVFVNPGWDVFALDNRTPELVGAATLGRPVVDFIAGRETQHIYSRILERARHGVEMTLLFRCDSPSLRRHLSLAIAASGQDEIEFRSRVLKVEPRSSVAVLEPGSPRSDALLTLCSWCNRGRIGDRWAEIEDVVAELRLFEAVVPQLTHGMCPQCVALIAAELAS